MNWIEAIILGVLQGLTEFLPISSSGHLELGKVLLDIEAKENLTFTVVVHGATVLSTIVVFYREIRSIITGSLSKDWNDSKRYLLKIFISMIPVLFVGVFLKEEVENFFTGNLVFVGSMLLITALLLTLTWFAKDKGKNISFIDSFLIGIAQAFAVLPGISRSGATIATGLLLKNERKKVAEFSFLMVLIPIIGANVKDILSKSGQIAGGIDILPLILGFLAAFLSGLLACRWMLKLVTKGRLVYFAIYCLIVGLIAITFG